MPYDHAGDLYVPDARERDTREAISLGIDALEVFASTDDPVERLEALHGAEELFRIAALGLMDEGAL